jgi:hypothetical protein
MNLSETMKIVATLKAMYPSWAPMEETPTAWARVLSDLSYDDVMSAVDSFAKTTSAFPPSVGQIREQVESLSGDTMTEGAHYDQLLSTIRREGYMSTTAMSRLSPENQKIVRRLGGWGQYGVNAMDEDDLRREYHFKFADAEREVRLDRERERLEALKAGGTDDEPKAIS